MLTSLLFGLLAACGGGIQKRGQVTAITISSDPPQSAVLLDGAFSRISANDDLRNAEIILLNSPGGRLNEAFTLVPHIQRNQATLIIPDGARCMSACLMLMAAADKVLVGPSADFLIHAASRYGSYSPEGTLKVRGYLTAYGWPADFVNEGAQKGAELRFDGREALQRGLAEGFVCGNIRKPEAIYRCDKYMTKLAGTLHDP